MEKQKCELCGEELTEEDDNDSDLGRCNDCYEEWRDQYPDRL